MKISARPLKGEAFDLEIDLDESVQDLKTKIANLKPEFPVEQQKLIYAGRILADGSPLKDYDIKEADFVVVMLVKAKAPAAASSATAPAAAPVAQGTAGTVSHTPAAPAPAAAEPTPVSYEAAASTLVTGANMEATIAQLCDMGFERAQVELCLRAAYNNPDRAVEYLMNGIPQDLSAGAPAAPHPAPAPGGAPAPGRPAPSSGGAGGGAGLAALAELRNHPRFTELARLVAANPAMLPQMLQALGSTNPGLLQAVHQNREAFLRMLQEAAGPRQPQDPVAAMLAAAQTGQTGHAPAAGGGAAPGAAPGAGQAPVAPAAPAPARVQLSQAEAEAVQRLSSLGFAPARALEAYLACDRNEELAANYLLENMEE